MNDKQLNLTRTKWDSLYEYKNSMSRSKNKIWPKKNYYKRKWNDYFWLLTCINDSLFMKTTKMNKILSCTVSSSSNWRLLVLAKKTKKQQQQRHNNRKGNWAVNQFLWEIQNSHQILEKNNSVEDFKQLSIYILISDVSNKSLKRHCNRTVLKKEHNSINSWTKKSL